MVLTGEFVIMEFLGVVEQHADNGCRLEWGRVDAQITGPGEVYSWESSWTFGNL